MLTLLKSTLLSHLRKNAQKALLKSQPTIIGIAGSVGKSSTRNALESVLKDQKKTLSVGNSETGIPLGILGMKPNTYSKKEWLQMAAKASFSTDFLIGTEYLIVEMGIDDPFPPKNMEYLLSILKPHIAISLNATATHTEQFEKSLTNKEKELPDDKKREIIIDKIALEDTKIITQSDCRLGIYNADDPDVSRHIKDKVSSSTVLKTFGDKNTNDISYGQHSVSLDGSVFKLFVKIDDKREEISLSFKDYVLPKEYREVFAATVLVCLDLGISLPTIISSLEKNYTLPRGRSSLLEGIEKSSIIDSSYNASKASVSAFLDLANTLKKETDRPLVFLFGDMRELGNESKIEHEDIAQKIIGVVDHLYLVGPQTREFILPVVQQNETSFKEIRWFDNAVRAGEFMKENLPKNAIVLVKGSQNTIFLEEAIKLILKNKSDEKLLCRQDDYWMKIKSS